MLPALWISIHLYYCHKLEQGQLKRKWHTTGAVLGYVWLSLTNSEYLWLPQAILGYP